MTKIGQRLSSDFKRAGGHLVACLGPQGTFSHIVARKRYPDSGIVFCDSIHMCFELVRVGYADIVIVPSESSSGGTIMQTVDELLVDYMEECVERQ